jgi:hypothetical protein
MRFKRHGTANGLLEENLIGRRNIEAIRHRSLEASLTSVTRDVQFSVTGIARSGAWPRRFPGIGRILSVGLQRP